MLPYNTSRMMRASRGPVTAGTTNYTTTGTTVITVPEYNTLVLTLEGATGGGGSGAGLGSNGSAGTASSISALSLTANGGGGGGRGPGGAAGSSGTASGGDTNTTGGSTANGGAGQDVGGGPAGDGGKGGKAVKTYSYGDPGAPTPGSSLSLSVGTAGAGGYYSSSGYADPGYNGLIKMVVS